MKYFYALQKPSAYAQRFVASNNATHSCDKSHNRWLCPLRSISANASACFSLRLRSARRGSRRRWHGIAAQSPRKEKEPDKRAVLIGIKKYDFIELRFQMMREILWFNIRGIFLLVIVRCFFLGIDKNK